MKLVDVNILLYAVNENDPLHAKVLSWWNDALNGDEPVGLAWSVIHGYLRLATHPKVFQQPQSPMVAVKQVNDWLAYDKVVIVAEAENHWELFRQFVVEVGAGGNLVADAHLAALAVSRGATLASCDNDFGRFRQVRWENPAT